jgi:uncharacterized protein (DUF2164 family)
MVSVQFSKEQKAEILESLQRYFQEELDNRLSDIQAGFLLEYFLKEIAPFAYNQGVEDAQQYFIAKTEDLTGTHFEEALTFWKNRDGKSRTVRRKSDG